MPLMDQNPAELNYAPPPAWHYRRHLWRWLVVFAIVASLPLAAHWAAPLWRRAQLLYWQQQCLNHVDPSNTTVMQFDSTGLIQQPLVPQAWNKFYTQLSPPGFRSAGTVFLHERISPAGHSRLVAIDLYLTNDGSGHLLAVGCGSRLIIPGNLLTDPLEIPTADTLNWMLPPTGSCRVLAGIADPSNRAHFTFQLQTGADTFLIDGWLRDDDRIAIESHRLLPNSATR